MYARSRGAATRRDLDGDRRCTSRPGRSLGASSRPRDTRRRGVPSGRADRPPFVLAAVVTLAQSRVEEHSVFPAGERDADGLGRSTEIGGEDRVVAAIDTPVSQLPRCSRPAADSRPWFQPVAMPASLSLVVECVSTVTSMVMEPSSHAVRACAMGDSAARSGTGLSGGIADTAGSGLCRSRVRA